MGEMEFARKGLVKAVDAALQAQILGMKKIIRDESLRRALAHLAPNQPKLCSDKERAARRAQLARSTAWMDTALSESTREALRTPWILDADTSVKVLYGHQAGAEIGYNPTKPGRPSHTLPAYWIGNLRLVLDVEVQGGKANAAKHSLPRLRELIEGLAPEERPVLVRGDMGFGNEGVMAESEEIGQRYLFKLKQTPGVKRLIERLWRQGDWQGVGQGFEAVEGELRLAGWSGARRVVVLRQPVKSSLVAQTSRKSRQPELQFLDPSETTKVLGVRRPGVQRGLLAGGHGPALPGSGRLRERLRRTEESMGLGRLHHARSGALQPLGASGGTDLQLVELVCPPGASKGPPGGDHQPPPTARWYRPPNSARRQIPPAAHTLPCGGRSDQGDDRQYPQGS
ncbi:MAG: hypothetical protein AW06_004255 [Candidatus Accumulibacter cognatus]|uniref:Transposase DDE domain-containing protein n=1 Tax=Candidatus Accumulibacter cognatus TaxID=2954383 RepID=A0A080M0R7_9PROT|nr:MAG: hypothetical protein AW06_004255 [Candidatus Accumulibacter cognatus]